MNSHVFSGESKMNQAHACGLLVCDLELFVIFFLQCIILSFIFMLQFSQVFIMENIYICVLRFLFCDILVTISLSVPPTPPGGQWFTFLQ